MPNKKAKATEDTMVDKIRKLMRPIITFCFVGTVTYLAVIGKIKPDAILQLTGIIIAFYFAERAALKKPKE